MSRDIPDNAEVVQPIFEELRKNFYSGATRSTKFRKQAIQRLHDGYVALQDEISAALKEDLGLNEFTANFGAHCITKAEFKDLLDGVDSWAKPQSVPTPLGTTKII